MSHFTVTVCLPSGTDPEKIQATLDDIMERWNENCEVPPYKAFEDGAAEDFWWVSAGRDNPESESAQILGEAPTTWAKVVEAYNKVYHPGNEIAIPGDEDPAESNEDRLILDEETGRAYTWSTRNPESMWDWWVIGGRWRNHFHAKQGVDASALILSEPHYTEKYLKPGDEVQKWAPNNGLRCDGGPIGLLDFDSMRTEAANEAAERFGEWEKICADTPHAEPWTHFAGLAEFGELTWDQARDFYHSQPRVKKLAVHEKLRLRDNPIGEFMPGREEYIELARRAAVPAYALITLQREWVAPGRMSLFGMSSDEPGTRDAFKTAANKYLESLPDDVIVVQIDCHI